MRDCAINIKPQIVGTFSSTDDEIKVEDITMNSNNNLVLSIKVNESIIQACKSSKLICKMQEPKNKRKRQTSPNLAK